MAQKRTPTGRVNGAGSLEETLAGIHKQFGAASLMPLAGSIEPVEVISTGSIALNYALGVGGIARGRITEFYGPESGGKTTIALHVVREVQRLGGIAAFIDAEHALDPKRCAALGIDPLALQVSQPDSGEQALGIVDWLVRSGNVDLVVVDSVAALTPQAEIDGEMGDSHPGLQARLMSQALRKLVGGFKDNRCALIFINQLREKIGVFFGSPETTAGGKALKFYASVRVSIAITERIKVGTETIGNHLKVKVVKNKLGNPHREAEFDLMYADGINRPGELLSLGLTYGAVGKSGNFYTYDGVSLGNGREQARSAIAVMPAEVQQTLEDQIMSVMGSVVVAPTPEPAELIQDEVPGDPFGPARAVNANVSGP